MVGIPLSSIKEDLHKVPDEFNEKPVLTILDGEARLAKHVGLIQLRYGEAFDFSKDARQLSIELFVDFSFDEICKMHYSASIMGDKSQEDLFERIPPYTILKKIMSSMWKYGYNSATWNDVVEHYNNIRSFRFTENPHFTVTLDHVPSFGAFSYAKYSKGLYLDGAFGYLVHYKGKHVMTIGFSLLDGKSVLVSQVQLCKKTGNRFLYKLPANRVELVLDLFHRHFPGNRIYIVDGKSLVDKNLRGYRETRDNKTESLRKNQTYLPKNQYPPEYVEKVQQDITRLEEKIQHLESDEKRLVKLYREIGKYKRKRKKVTKHDLTYREVGLKPTALWF